MGLSFEKTFIEVWRQALVENATAVKLDGDLYPVRRTPKRGLRQADFAFYGDQLRDRSRTRKRNPSGQSWRGLERK